MLTTLAMANDRSLCLLAGTARGDVADALAREGGRRLPGSIPQLTEDNA